MNNPSRNPSPSVRFPVVTDFPGDFLNTSMPEVNHLLHNVGGERSGNPQILRNILNSSHVLFSLCTGINFWNECVGINSKEKFLNSWQKKRKTKQLQFSLMKIDIFHITFKKITNPLQILRFFVKKFSYIIY